MKKQPTRESPEFYHVQIWVKPMPGHPFYWQVEFGLLSIFLFDLTPEAAEAKALKIVELLPYELMKRPVKVDPDSIKFPACFLEARNRAMSAGLSLQFSGVSTGASIPGFS